MNKINLQSARYLFRELAHTALHLAILLAAAGDWRWLNAWLIAGLGWAFQLANAAVLYRVNPELLEKRGKVLQEGTKGFDRVFVGVYFALAISASVVAGLDAKRFGWLLLPGWCVPAGVFIFGISCMLGAWAMAVNPHFETTVVVGASNEHKVITQGPYRYLRHPGYAAAMIGSLSYPLILRSGLCFVPTALVVILFGVRTWLEDQTLMKELPGYREYAEKTRFRLLPYVF